jgi:hypothetical protein
VKKKVKDSKPLLPAKAPKKSGKRGVGPKPDPIDPVADFETPAKQEPQGSALPEEAKAKKGPKQGRLPTMEDPAIEELEDSAENYSDIRDQRMELTREEVRLKTELLGLMKKHSKSSYTHNGYDIKVIVESEKLRVRIKKED